MFLLVVDGFGVTARVAAVVALAAAGTMAQAQRFVEFLLGPNAQAIFERNGFAPA